MRGTPSFERKVEEMKPSKSDINWVIMDYLVSEGYPGAAEKFAHETNVCTPLDVADIRERVCIRDAIHAGDVQKAIDLINEGESQILDSNHALHFNLLQLQLIEIIRGILQNPDTSKPKAYAFEPAIEFARDQLAPRAPTDKKHQEALEKTMSLMLFPSDKMTTEIMELLDPALRASVATSINEALLQSKGERPQAKIRQLVRARVWAETAAREAKIDTFPINLEVGLDPQPAYQADEMVQ